MLSQKAWFTNASQTLVEHANRGRKINSNQEKEARQRSKNLSTSSSKMGVSFAGAAFQAQYYQTKFTKRGNLVYAILFDLRSQLCFNTHMEVASIGGGPGTDAAGLVWIQKELFAKSSIHCTLYDYETSWKSYTKTLNTLYGEHVDVVFDKCDVTQSLSSDVNRKVRIDSLDLILLFYICHETSGRQQPSLQFYKDVAKQAKKGAIIVFADVMIYSKKHLADVVLVMARIRGMKPLLQSKTHQAEVIAFRFGDLQEES